MQKLARLLAGSAVLATVALSVPGAALAGSMGNDWIPFHLRDMPDRTWISGNTTFNKDDPHYDKVMLDLQNGGDGELCAQVREFRDGSPPFEQVCYKPGEDGKKELASGLRSGTYSVDFMRHGGGSDKNFGGRIGY